MGCFNLATASAKMVEISCLKLIFKFEFYSVPGGGYTPLITLVCFVLRSLVMQVHLKTWIFYNHQEDPLFRDGMMIH